MSDSCSSGPYRDSRLLLIFSVTLISIMGVNTILPSFPGIISEFGIAPEQISLLITVFTLPGVLLTPALGVLTDRFGRKPILIPALLLFGLAGGACAITRDFQVLVLLRFIQGIGSAALCNIYVVLIGDFYSGQTRTRILGYNAGMHSFGAASYPIIGGFLASFSWFYPFLLFFLAVPLSVVIILWLSVSEPTSTTSFRANLDLVWAAIRNRFAVGALIAGFTTFIMLYGAFITFLPIFLGSILSASPVVIGLVVATRPIATILTSSQLGRFTQKRSEATLIKTAFLLYIFSLGIIPLLRNVWLLILPSVLFGVAQGLNIPSVQSILTGLVGQEQRGQITAAYGVAISSGQTVGPILMAGVYTLAGIDAVFLIASLVALATILILVPLTPAKLDMASMVRRHR